MESSYHTNHVLLRASNLGKSYGEHVVLEGLNLEIRDLRRLDQAQAQVVSILGPSGVGKTTFFNLLAGLQEATVGSVLIDNPASVPVEGLVDNDLIPASRGLVGVVYQNYQLFNFKKVESLLSEGLKNSGKKLPKDAFQKKVNEFLNWFGLVDHREKFPFQLSGGQRQRVAIAQQLLRTPQLLLMDEPFSGLDPETKNGVIRMIQELASKDEYLTIIIISHDIYSSLRVSDTVYMMGRNRDAEGRVLAGASILGDMTINLVEKGLAWKNDESTLRRLSDLEREIKTQFSFLSGK